MKVQVNDAPKSQKELLIEIPAETYDKASETECKRIAATVKMPGFRPGKAPMDMVKKQHIHSIRQAALEKVINDAIRTAIMDNKIGAVSAPEVRDIDFQDGKPIAIKAYVDVYPEFTMTNYKGYDFEKISVVVTEEDVKTTVDGLLEQKSTFEPIETPRPVESGDQVIIDFVGKVDDVPFDGGSAKGHALEIGSGQFIPGFEEQIIGMNANEERDVKVTFPENYHEATLAGKEAVFSVILNEIKFKSKPELNEEFAKSLTERADSVDKLLELIKIDLEEDSQQAVRYETMTEMLDKLVEENTFDIPYTIAKEQAERLANQNLQQYYKMGINPEMFGITPESLISNFMGEAERQVKHALIINKIAEIESITVEDEDLEKEYEKIATRTGKDVEEIRKQVSGSDHLAAFKNDVLSNKVYDYLCNVNKMNERSLSRKEYEEYRREKQKEKHAHEHSHEDGHNHDHNHEHGHGNHSHDDHSHSHDDANGEDTDKEVK